MLVVRGSRVMISCGFKVTFCLKNDSMEFLLCPITWRINVLYESRMKWTWHHSKLAVKEVSFFGGLKSSSLSTIIYTWENSGRYELGCHAPMCLSDIKIESFGIVFIPKLIKTYEWKLPRSIKGLCCQFKNCHHGEYACSRMILSTELNFYNDKPNSTY